MANSSHDHAGPVSGALKLQPRLGPWHAASIVVGTIIGTGIFLKTATMAQLLGSLPAVLFAWVVGGVLSYAGALTYAELAARLPRSGGEYAILREAFGPRLGFLYGWMRFLVGSPATIAAYAVGAATFLGGVLPLEQQVPGGIKTVALGWIALFSGLNCLAVSFGAGVQAFLTALKVALVLALIGGILFFGGPQPEIAAAGAAGVATPGASAFGLALIAALWAYDGWNNLAMIGDEVRDPQRNIPRALGMGVLLVAVLYVGVNWAYFLALPLETIQGANSSLHPDALPVATLAAQGFLGEWGIPVLSVAFVISAVGAMNGSILTGARVPFAMARDGLFWQRLARVGSHAHVPVTAVVVQGCLAAVLALSGTFDQLTDYVVVAGWAFYAVTASALFRLRRIQIGITPRFRVPGYPAVPILFILAALLLIGNSLWNSPMKGMFGGVILLAGLPVFEIFNRRLAAARAAGSS